MSTGRAIAMIDYKTGDCPSELLERAIAIIPDSAAKSLVDEVEFLIFLEVGE